MVPGCATIRSAGTATKYPPDAATLPIDTTTGFPASRARDTSRQMVSEATYDPPGLSMRNTMARTRSASTAERNAAASVSLPMPTSPDIGSTPLLPRLTAPTPWISATVSPPAGGGPARAT